MGRAVAELVGGPDDGITRAVNFAEFIPDRLAALDGRELYRATGHMIGYDRHRYDWEYPHSGRRRPACGEHNPLHAGCPGYQPKAADA